MSSYFLRTGSSVAVMNQSSAPVVLVSYTKQPGYMCDALHDLVPFVQFKKCENTNGKVFLLIQLQSEACNFTKSITLPWVHFTFFLKLYKWYQITYMTNHIYDVSYMTFAESGIWTGYNFLLLSYNLSRPAHLPKLHQHIPFHTCLLPLSPKYFY